MSTSAGEAHRDIPSHLNLWSANTMKILSLYTINWTQPRKADGHYFESVKEKVIAKIKKDICPQPNICDHNLPKNRCWYYEIKSENGSRRKFPNVMMSNKSLLILEQYFEKRYLEMIDELENVLSGRSTEFSNSFERPSEFYLMAQYLYDGAHLSLSNYLDIELEDEPYTHKISILEDFIVYRDKNYKKILEELNSK